MGMQLISNEIIYLIQKIIITYNTLIHACRVRNKSNYITPCTLAGVVGIYAATISNDRVDYFPATKGPAPDMPPVN